VYGRPEASSASSVLRWSSARAAVSLGRVDHDPVLGGAALVDLAAGDQQHPVTGGEDAVEGLGGAVVGDGDLHAARREPGGLLLAADDGRDLLGRNLLQQPLDDELAEMPGRSGDDDAHGETPPGGRVRH
jgi:hypothetical protein